MTTTHHHNDYPILMNHRSNIRRVVIENVNKLMSYLDSGDDSPFVNGKLCLIDWSDRDDMVDHSTTVHIEKQEHGYRIDYEPSDWNQHIYHMSRDDVISLCKHLYFMHDTASLDLTLGHHKEELPEYLRELHGFQHPNEILFKKNMKQLRDLHKSRYGLFNLF